MSLHCGIIGLPNVGKSTIFRALTSAPAEVGNYPFCTIDPNVGVVAVPDPRLNEIAAIIESSRQIPTSIRVVDIAGLVRGASQGEGLGNRFLAHIREASVLIHVVRCFESKEISHVEERISPVSDIDIIQTELALADLTMIENRLAHIAKRRLQQEALQKEYTLLNQLLEKVQQTPPPTYHAFTDPPVQEYLRQFPLLLAKPQIVVCNVMSEGDSEYLRQVYTRVGEENCIAINGGLESQIAQLESEAEKKEMLALYNATPMLDTLVRVAYTLLNLATFFTAGANESRAWTFLRGETIAQAAGRIHTDFEKNFIKADVYHINDLRQHPSESSLRKAGKIRTEGASYLVQDGDVIFVKSR